MYSRLGRCLGVTAKLGSLAGTDLCAWVKGLLDKLMTHLGLGSSNELLVEEGGKHWMPGHQCLPGVPGTWLGKQGEEC